MFKKSRSSLQPLIDKLIGRIQHDEIPFELQNTDINAIINLPYHWKKIERHGYLVREREKATHCFVLISGFAIQHKTTMGGCRQILGVNMKDDLIDVESSFLTVADFSVQVLTDSEVAFIPRTAIRRLAFEHPVVGMAMWHESLVTASIYREWIANIGRRDAHARVAHLLCEMSLRMKIAGLGEKTSYDLPMTQEQLADCVGLTPVHINRTLKSLEATGLITRKSSKRIFIDDWTKLADAGDFDSGYLHLFAADHIAP